MAGRCLSSESAIRESALNLRWRSSCLLINREDTILRSLTHDEIIVKAKGGLVDKKIKPICKNLWGKETSA